MIPTGWRLTWILSLGLLVMSLLVLVVYGSEEVGVRTWIRATARSSGLLFLLTFAINTVSEVVRQSLRRRFGRF